MEDSGDISKVAISEMQAKEEEIERKKMEVRERVELQLGRAEEKTRRLAQIWEELEEFGDPLGKEVTIARKRIDIANQDLKPLGICCQKKEKEYKEAMEGFNEKSKEKAQLAATLMELHDRNKELFKKLFPRFNSDDFAGFAEHFLDICSELSKYGTKRSDRDDGNVLLRSLSVGSPRIASRRIGGDEEDALKLERFKVKTIDINGGGGTGGSAPPSGGGPTPKPGGSKSK